MRLTRRETIRYFVAMTLTVGGCSNSTTPAPAQNQEKAEEAKNRAMEEAKAKMEEEMKRRRSGGGPGGPQ